MRDHLVFGKVIVRLLKSYEGMGVVHIEALATVGALNTTRGPLLGSTTIDCLWAVNVSESYSTRFDVKKPQDISGGSESVGQQAAGGMILVFTILKPPANKKQASRKSSKIKILEVSIV